MRANFFVKKFNFSFRVLLFKYVQKKQLSKFLSMVTYDFNLILKINEKKIRDKFSLAR